MDWRRFDTLFLRLFMLMWVVLVGSHLVAFLTVTGGGPAGHGPPDWPVLPSLPPGEPFDASGPPGPGPGPGKLPGGGLPARALWLDYGLRALVIALGAALGARWLAAPMRRLSDAAAHLADGLAHGRAPTTLDERHGTHEVRAVAQVFNDMAQRLQAQFDARGLQMAAVSHDLRTPLTRLRLRLEALAPEVADAAAADIREMDEMIDATLAVLREQRDGSGAVPVDLAALVQAIVDDLAEQGHDVTATGLFPARVLAHPAALRRIVANLAGNALRHGQRARIGVAPAPDGVELTIDDDGPGIPPDQIELAFQPWVRLASGGSAGGHGLGLAIARDLAGRDGAQLTLANRPGGGLRARLLLRPA